MLRTSLFAFLLFTLPLAATEPESFALQTRSRVEVAPGTSRYHTITTPTKWEAAKTAVIVCDMWDAHWCPSATARVAELAPRLNDYLVAARKKGALIIHCPSDCMEFYKDTPQRKLAQNAPKVVPKVPLERWCKLDPKEGKLPIDDSNGGCAEDIKSFKAWKRQHPAINIEAGDAITDSEEAFNLLRSRGIDNVLITGVHTNMCVLGRPFGIRQLVKQGFRVALVRDLTDTMYSSKSEPFVSHFTGTDLVVEHIEKHWCPSVLSGDLLDGKEFRFKEDKRPTLVIVAAETEYKTVDSLPVFALKHLGQDYRVQFVFADEKEKNRLPGLDQLKTADLLLLSQRRKPLHKDDMAIVKAYIAAGKPLVAIRTSCHAFAPFKGEKLAADVVEWPTFDQDILGCNYANHYTQTIVTRISLAPGEEAKKHPILAGIPESFESKSGMYKLKPLAKDCIPLLVGKCGEYPEEPLAWVREKTAEHGRIAFIALAHTSDFANDIYPKLLANACRWAAGK